MEGPLPAGPGCERHPGDPTFKEDSEWTLDEIRNWQDNDWTLTFPDGRQVRGTGLMADEMINRNWREQRQLDPNRNAVTITINRTLTEDGAPVDVIRDAVGRTIRIERGAGEMGRDLVRLQGARARDEAARASPTLTWTVDWGDFKVCRDYLTAPEDTQGSPHSEDNGVPEKSLSETQLRMVNWIEPPAQLGGSADHRFDFTYNATPRTLSCQSNPSRGLGEIRSVQVPSGARATYDYRQDNTGLITSADFVLWNAITRKQLAYRAVEADGDRTVTETWNYRISPSLSAVVTAPGGGKTLETFSDGLLTRRVRCPETRISANGGDCQTPSTVTERIWEFNVPDVPGSSALKTANPRVKRELTTLTGTAAVTAVKDFAYDRNGNLTRLDEYDWGTPPRDTHGQPTLGRLSSADLRRRTRHTYHRNALSDVYHKATSPRLKTARASTEVLAGGVTRQSYRQFVYDGDDAATTGNLKAERIWDSGRGSFSAARAITIAHDYDRFGNRTSTTDGEGNVTRSTFGTIAGTGSASGLYPTRMVEASGKSVARTMTYRYDFHTGAVTSETDADNGVTTRTELDAVGRPILVKEAAGKSEERWTRTWYCDRQRRLIVHSDLHARDDGLLVTVTDYDPLGRERLSRTYEGNAPRPAGSSLNARCGAYDDETKGIKVKTLYRSSGLFSYTATSNPHRETGEATMGWTRTKRDHLGRTVEVATFEREALPAPWGSNGSSTGTATTAYDAEYTTVTDAAGRKRRSKQDGLGRLVRVDEPDGDADLGEPHSPIQPTHYGYDALDNLTGVSQGRQTRTFRYDSLSRLTQATNPESGTTRYSYDNNGNLTWKRDARGMETTYSYDALDRLTRRSYSYEPSGGQIDPAVSLDTSRVVYAYDDCGRHSKGRMCSVAARKGATEVSRTAYAGYDALGRVGESIQTTGGAAYRFGYAYDRAGNMISQTYPSGKVVETLYDGAGRIAGVREKQGESLYRYYAGGAAAEADPIDYAAHGGIEQLRLGNGLREQRSYNRRLQPTRIELMGTGEGNPGRLLRLDYSYGTRSNNGNVLSQQIRAGELNVTQRYDYDELNRLKKATETGTGTGWSQTYVYDRYGNRAVESGASHGSHEALTPTALTNFSSRYNRLRGGAAYDAGGNLTRDWGGRSFAYDGDNRMVSFTDPGPGGINTSSTYSYDGEGRRVLKTTGGVTTTYVYNVLGQLVAEYGGRAEAAATRYLTPDHLGSTRVVTGAEGEVLTRHDYLPFGEEIGTEYGDRRFIEGYTRTLLDGPAQKFTGKERDGESGLDYFQARYFSGAGGRFTSADAPLVDQFAENPQSWNLYVYSRNNPLRFIDPTGRECIALDDGTIVDDGQGTLCEQVSEGDREEQNNPSVTVHTGSLNVFAEAFAGEMDRRASGIKKTIVVVGAGSVAAGVIGGAAASAGTLTLAGRVTTLGPLLMREELLRKVQDPKLRNIIDQLYRRGATIGDGGTAAAVRAERATGQPIGGKFHSIKARININALENWLRNNPTASQNDRTIAQSLKRDLQNSMK